MKNTIDLTENRVFRDKKPERRFASLWKNYGNKDSQMAEYKESLKKFEDSLYSFMNSTNERHILSTDGRYISNISTTSSNTNRIFSFNYVNDDSRLNTETYYVIDNPRLSTDRNYIELNSNSKLLSINHRQKRFLGIIGATKTIQEYIRNQLPVYRPLRFKEKDNCVKNHLENIISLLHPIPDMTCKGSVMYPFDLPEYLYPMETPYHHRMSVFTSKNISDKSITLRGLWKNYKYGEKNPLNTWNLDPDFYDKDIKMPDDTHFMDRNPNVENYIEGIN